MCKAYEIITNRFIEMLEKGVSPWKQTWHSRKQGIAQNMVSKKQYRGINFFTTNFSEYESHLWGTYKQIQSLGGQVKKGEKGTPIVFFSTFEKEKEGQDKPDVIPFMRLSYVFNALQCDGLKLPEIEPLPEYEHDPIKACENVIKSFPLGFPEVRHEETRAYYNRALDYINMPKMSLFPEVEHYYSTYFHEAIHATGHKARLNREGVAGTSYFGDATYSKEELIAELGSAFMCSHTGINDTTENNSASYLYGWIKVLKEQPKILLQSASAAQKASDYLLGVKHD